MRFLLSFVSMAAIAAALSCTGRAPMPSDLLILNARVYTVDDANPWSEAVSIQGDRIAWVGTTADAAHQRGPRTKVIDAGGRLLLPGFIDSHNHIRYGNEPHTVRLQGAQSLDEIRALVSTFSSGNPELEWLTGGGWSYLEDRPEGLPSAEDLDGTTDGRPAFFISYDAHTAWLNREAMERIGLRPGSELAAREEVVVDRQTGEPTGIVQSVVSLGDDNQIMSLLWAEVPDEAGLYESFQESLRMAARYGITTIVAPQTSIEELDQFVRARDEGILTSRVQIAMFHPPATTSAELAELVLATERYDDDRMRVSAIKLYIDDVIEAHSAAMLEPYADLPTRTTGTTFYTPEAFDALVTKLDGRGAQLFIHAIGDRGIRVALDALEAARTSNGPRDSRHQLVHVELVSEPDLTRFGELGVVACMQPRHVLPESNANWVKAVGDDKLAYAFPWRSLHEAGAVLAFSSDWDVAEMDPLIGIYSAVTRKGLDGKPEAGFVPSQRVDVATAIRAYTLDGAYANFADGNRGSIEIGKYADLVLLSADLLEIPADQIKEARVVMTMVGGRIIHRAF